MNELITRIARSDSVRRAIRTFLQVWLAVFIAMTAGVEGVPDYDLLRRAVAAATWAGIAAVVTWLHNALEDRGAVPRVLK